ncbi:MAG: phage major capsid protein [Oceanicoccus sp.]
MSELTETIEELGETFVEFKKSVDDRISDIETKSNRIGNTMMKGAGVNHKAAERFLKSGDTSELHEKAMSTTIGGDGGHMVVPALHDEILRRLTEGNPLRRLVRMIPNVQSNSFEQLVSVGGAQALRKAELSTRSETNSPTLQKVTIGLTELSAIPAMTSELISSSGFNVVEWLAQEVADSFAAKERYEWLYGTGVEEAKGILSYTLTADADGSRTFGEIQEITSTTSATFKSEDLTALIYSMQAQYRPGAVWLMSTDAILTARNLKDVDGRPLWQDGLSLGQPPSLLGYEVVELSDLPAVGAGANSIIFANLQRGYTVAENPAHAGVLRDEITQPGFVKFYTRTMTGAGVIDDRAVKVLQMAV